MGACIGAGFWRKLGLVAEYLSLWVLYGVTELSLTTGADCFTTGSKTCLLFPGPYSAKNSARALSASLTVGLGGRNTDPVPEPGVGHRLCWRNVQVFCLGWKVLPVGQVR